MPEISVIVPVYNVEDYLQRWIDSILSQTFPNFELILIDDGSTDHCGRICDDNAIKDSRIRVIHQKNSGVANARNTGIDCSRGEYIAFVDSDDYLKNDFLETLYKEIVINDADCVSSEFMTVDDSGKIKHTQRFEQACRTFDDPQDRLSYILDDVLQGRTGWEMCTRLFRSSIIKGENIHVCEFCNNFAEDMAFFLSFLLSCNKIVTVNYSGYYYFQRETSMMRNSAKIVRLNEVNEVSQWYFEQINSKNEYLFIKNYYKIHFLIIKNQLDKLIFLNNTECIPQISKTIVSQEWYKHYTLKAILHMKQMFSKEQKPEMLTYRNICWYTLHKNPFLYRVNEILTWKLMKH